MSCGPLDAANMLLDASKHFLIG